MGQFPAIVTTGAAPGILPRLSAVCAAPRTVTRPPIPPHCDGGFMRMRLSEHGFRTVSSYLHSVENPASALIALVSGMAVSTIVKYISFLYEVLSMERIWKHGRSPKDMLSCIGALKPALETRSGRSVLYIYEVATARSLSLVETVLMADTARSAFSTCSLRHWPS